MSHAFIPTQKDVGDLSFMDRYAEIRKRMYAKRPEPKKPEPPKHEPSFNWRFAPAYLPPGGAWHLDQRLLWSFQYPTQQKSGRQICHEVCEKHGITFNDLVSERRHAALVEARREAVYRMRSETTLSFPKMGRILRRDHSSLVHAYQRYCELQRQQEATP